MTHDIVNIVTMMQIQENFRYLRYYFVLSEVFYLGNRQGTAGKQIRCTRYNVSVEPQIMPLHHTKCFPTDTPYYCTTSNVSIPMFSHGYTVLLNHTTCFHSDTSYYNTTPNVSKQTHHATIHHTTINHGSQESLIRKERKVLNTSSTKNPYLAHRHVTQNLST